tara:strand:- start:178 stop:1680 length:1503 start_codon:yes stop_codon:yes gene_type:complete
MILNSNLIRYLGLLFILISCLEKELDKLNHTNQLIEFSILKKNNPQLDNDIHFNINNNYVYGYSEDFLNGDNLIASFKHNAKSISINSILQISDSSVNNFSNTMIYELKAENGNSNFYSIVLESFTKIPVIFIETDSLKQIKSKKEYIEGDLIFYGRDFYKNYINEKILIRGRGHFTWSLPKKPYQVKFLEKNSLFDLQADKKWIFLANYLDLTMLRNSIAFELGYLSNLSWTPKYDYAELFINNVYQGTYQITEKIEIDNHRLNIDDNSFLLEIDQEERMDSDDIFFKTDNNLFRIKSPEDISMSSYEYIFINDFIKNIETLLFSGQYEEFKKLVNIESFVDWYLINEISKDDDGRFFSSVHMHLDPSVGKLFMGPIWDYDIAFGNIFRNNNEDPTGFWIKDNANWYVELFKSKEFVEKVKLRFNYFYSNKDKIENTINQLSLRINKSRIENNKVWNTLGKKIIPIIGFEFNSFDQEQNHLNQWLNIRFNWLKDELQKL